MQADQLTPNFRQYLARTIGDRVTWPTSTLRDQLKETQTLLLQLSEELVNIAERFRSQRGNRLGNEEWTGVHAQDRFGTTLQHFAGQIAEREAIEGLLLSELALRSAQDTDRGSDIGGGVVVEQERALGGGEAAESGGV